MAVKTITQIANVPLESFIGNASGPKDATLEELEVIAESGSSIIMMKTCTIEPRAGNEEPRYARLPHGSIQSMGLPNLGYKKYIEFAKILKSNYKKPVIASVAGFSEEEFIFLVEQFQSSEVDLIEVNLSCPNIDGKGQIGYDPMATESLLNKLSGLGEKAIGLKLPPYLETYHIQNMAGIIKNSSVKFITCINSIGNTLVIDAESEQSIIKPRGGLGGLCGAYIKPIALANVRQFRQALGENFSIFGVGGVSTGTDAFEFLLAGANAVQVATVFETEGPGSFERIDNELSALLEKKGHNSIGDARGRLNHS